MPAAEQWVRRARPLLGTLVEIGVRSPAAESDVHRIAALAFAVVTQVHLLMSAHDPGSELSRLNREALSAPWPAHPHVLAVLRAAIGFARESEGAFDPCVAAVLETGGLLPRHGLRRIVPGATWRDIELGAEGTVRFHRPLRIDLGGIAKGYAVDLAFTALADRLPGDIVVNAGGDLRVAGEPQAVVLRDPASGRPGGHTVTLADGALASSARLPATAQAACHLVDPHSGRADPGCAASVIAHDCMTADALTKVLLFAPAALAARVLANHDARALVVPDRRTA